MGSHLGREGDHRVRPRHDLSHVAVGLKDFQRATVDYAFKRLYLDDDPVTRFLVADEVGLGKTLVARGLIARTIEHLQDSVERIDIVYVCSNADIARQNVARLNVSSQDDFALPPRITLLPTRLRDLNRPDPDGKAKVNFVSFTPGTSFDLGNRSGVSYERVLLHNLLARAWGKQAVSGAGAINVLRATAGFEGFRDAVRAFDPSSVDDTLANAFVAALKRRDESTTEDERTLEELFADLRRRMTRARTRRRDAERHDQLALVGELRRILAKSCVEALEPDLVILDEFQRFKHLLDRTLESGQLAHDLFDHPDVRVLLLSATPYKMYTVAEDVTDDHYSDFLDTLRFLFCDDESKLARFNRDLRAYREMLIGGAASDLSLLRRRRGRVERELRGVMARTERLAATPDRNGMLVERLPAVSLASSEVRSYVALDQLADHLDAGDVLEYWKSTPYLMNFMEEYRLGKALERPRSDGEHVELARIGRNADRIDWDAYESYRPVSPGNARMRALFDEVIARDAWKMLWIAPSLPYYRLGGAYQSPACATFTKRLVFSAWVAVPRAIATLTSYEAERRIMRATPGRPPSNTVAGREKMKPLLRFARSKGRLVGMPVFALVYPSPALAELADPLELAIRHASNDRGALDLASVRRIARDLANEALAPLVAGRDGPPDLRWYWAAPLLLDDCADNGSITWLERWNAAASWTGSDASETSSLAEHITAALELVYSERTPERSDLGTPPADLADLVGLLALAGPATCALRALNRSSAAPGDAQSEARRSAAARIAWGLRSLFNLPEATHLARLRSTPYWQRVLEYSLDGCLQAVLDEYAHVLPEWLGIADRPPDVVAAGIGEAMFEVLSLRRVSYGVRDLSDRIEPIKRRTMGGRFALRFGDERSDDGGESRRSHVRTAFNSPFWPFVLATTSVGQEGLDFHLYCHAVVHWNLPANPVDLEQREGRVHRYKGHAVRRNLAAALGSDALQAQDTNVWNWMFAAGARGRAKGESDIVPLWVFTEGTARIERIVPALPLSRDVSRLEVLKRSLVAYRLAFGQPRQEELIAYMRDRFGDDEIEQLKAELHIDLSPKRHGTRSAAAP